MDKPKEIKIIGNFSWERPIEDQILEYVRYMAESMEERSRHGLETGWFANNRLQEDCEKMAMAYRMVEKKILDIIKLTHSLPKTGNK